MYLDNNIKYIFCVYIIICLILYYIKPSFMFNKNEFKQFGVTKDKTIFPFWLVSIIITYILYFVMLLKCEDYI